LWTEFFLVIIYFSFNDSGINTNDTLLSDISNLHHLTFSAIAWVELYQFMYFVSMKPLFHFAFSMDSLLSTSLISTLMYYFFFLLIVHLDLNVPFHLDFYDRA
jgi:hypothetical protein